MLGNKIGAEQDLAHLHRIDRARFLGDRSHERFVRPAHMRVQHVEMALVDRDIGRLADRAAGMVQPFRHVGQFHELLEIGHGGVAPPAFVVAHEGRAIDRGQHQVAPADLDIAVAVAGDLGVLRGRGGAELAGQAAGDAHPLAGDIGAGLAPARQGGRVVDEVDADFLQHRLGIVFDDLDRLRGEDLEIGDVAGDEARGLDPRRGALGAARGATAATGAASAACGLPFLVVLVHSLRLPVYRSAKPPGHGPGRGDKHLRCLLYQLNDRDPTGLTGCFRPSLGQLRHAGDRTRPKPYRDAI